MGWACYRLSIKDLAAAKVQTLGSYGPGGSGSRMTDVVIVELPQGPRSILKAATLV